MDAAGAMAWACAKKARRPWPQKGAPRSEILAQYFPGAEAADEATGRAWQSFAGEGFVLESLDAADAAFLPDLNRARAEASQRSGLNAAAPFTVRAFASTPAFREATLAPGWVAAFTEGDWIGDAAAAHAGCAATAGRNHAPRVSARAGGARSRTEGAALAARRAGRSMERDRAPATSRRQPGPTLKHRRESTPRSRTHASEANPKPRIAPPRGTPRSCSRATAARRCSIGCAQAFPPASSPLSGSGSLTDRIVRRVGPAAPRAAGTRDASTSNSR